jgi:hypothetical protein
MAYGFMQMTLNGQEILWHLGGSARFVTMLALLPGQDLGIVVSYNTPPADDGRAILVRFMEDFFPVDRTPLAAAPLPGWETRAAHFDGTYAPARSNHSSAQRLVRYTATTPVAIREGRLAFNGWDFVETTPGLFHQVDGDRVLTLREDENGGRWLFVGVLAYFQVPWYETLDVLLAAVAGYLLLLMSLLIAWIFRRRSGTAPGGPAIILAAGLGVFNIGLFVWLLLQLLQYADTLVYPEEAVGLISRLYWLAIPWTLAILAVAAGAWLRRRWTPGWRIYYASLGLVSVAFVWLLWQINLLRV